MLSVRESVSAVSTVHSGGGRYMSGINFKRLLLSGLLAGLVIWLVEGAGAVFLYMELLESRLAELGLSMEMSGFHMAVTVLVSLLVGYTLMFFYVGVRPRFGPGPRTAVLVAVALWLGGYVVALLGYFLAGIYPNHLLVQWGAVGLFEMVVATLLGGWVYREAAEPS
jgi:hypothetical protein